jgi:hypothetical protein
VLDDEYGGDWSHATSGRDRLAIAKLGTELLDSPSPNIGEERDYLTTVTAAAYLREGQAAEARSVLEKEWGDSIIAGRMNCPCSRCRRSLDQPVHGAAHRPEAIRPAATTVDRRRTKANVRKIS